MGYVTLSQRYNAPKAFVYLGVDLIKELVMSDGRVHLCHDRMNFAVNRDDLDCFLLNLFLQKILIHTCKCDLVDGHTPFAGKCEFCAVSDREFAHLGEWRNYCIAIAVRESDKQTDVLNIGTLPYFFVLGRNRIREAFNLVINDPLKNHIVALDMTAEERDLIRFQLIPFGFRTPFLQFIHERVMLVKKAFVVIFVFFKCHLSFLLQVHQ